MPNDNDRQDHMFRFFPSKEADRSATFGEVETPKVLHGMTTASGSTTEACMLFFAQSARSAPKCHRDLQS